MSVFSSFGSVVESVILLRTQRDKEIIIALTVLICFYIFKVAVKKWRSKYPPGPCGLPFVGYIPFLTRNIYLDFIQLAKKYGEVFSLRLGSIDVIVLNGTDSIRDAFGKPEFNGRPPNSSLTLFIGNSPFFVKDQHTWIEHRRFFTQTMKDLGLGRSKIESDVQEEIHFFLETLHSSEGRPMDPKVPLSASMSNNICALVFGKRYDYDDPRRKTLDENLDASIEYAAQNAVHTFFPWIRHIPFNLQLFGLTKGLYHFKQIENISREEVEMHEQTLDPMNTRDFIDSYLLEMKQRQAKHANTTFKKEVMYSCVADIFAAGSETVRTSLLWLIYIIADHQDVQKKVQKEILDVIGTERKPTFVDQVSMPFTQAVILETLRWKTIVPINVLRYTVADTSVMGYDVPKGTIVLANLWAVHHDPKLWKDPEQFQPQRFLSPNGKSVVKSNNYMPFSVGKRACPGELMAYMELFLYFTSILQKFDIVLPEGEEASYPFQFSTVYRRDLYKVRFIPNNH